MHLPRLEFLGSRMCGSFWLLGVFGFDETVQSDGFKHFASVRFSHGQVGFVVESFDHA